MNPEDLLQPLLITQTRKCTLGCPLLDRLLAGGVPCNSVTELVAESGCGKTQISLQLLLTAQLPFSLGGLSASSLYLYSESPFPLRRLRQLSLSFPALQNPLDKILTHPLHSAYHLLDLLPRIDSILSRPPAPHSPIKLLVIDSIAALFRHEFENNLQELKQRSDLFFKISGKLKEQARRFGLAVVVVNQVVDVVSASESVWIRNSPSLYTSGRNVCAVLGLSWSNCVNTRLFLSKHEERVGEDGDGCALTQKRQFIRVVFSPYLPDSSCEFVIRKEGVFGVER
ncbi:PREDICTED: DNA repair protein XRCC3 homolog [Ipomoea nil]|uniref:DNA repair protein XRCC3 homolog n=1 Tax=Ipomoea nil TaxID=35883 RepID=UPI000900ECEA|nr:PREDICTED: DNA repair protein XRCC3 homolog [Ipomoea nil]